MHFDLRYSSLIKHIHTYVDRAWIIDLEFYHDDGGKRELVDRHKNEAFFPRRSIKSNKVHEVDPSGHIFYRVKLRSRPGPTITSWDSMHASKRTVRKRKAEEKGERSRTRNRQDVR